MHNRYIVYYDIPKLYRGGVSILDMRKIEIGDRFTHQEYDKVIVRDLVDHYENVNIIEDTEMNQVRLESGTVAKTVVSYQIETTDEVKSEKIHEFAVNTELIE